MREIEREEPSDRMSNINIYIHIFYVTDGLKKKKRCIHICMYTHAYIQKRKERPTKRDPVDNYGGVTEDVK